MKVFLEISQEHEQDLFQWLVSIEAGPFDRGFDRHFDGALIAGGLAAQDAYRQERHRLETEGRIK